MPIRVKNLSQHTAGNSPYKWNIVYSGDVQFHWKKQQADNQPDHTAHGDQKRSGAKGKPTPSRKEAEARNHRPLVPADRKEAKRQARTAARSLRDEQFRREQSALKTGDERYMPYRDKGRVKRFVRDWVDSRWLYTEFVLPLLVLIVVTQFIVSFIWPESPNSTPLAPIIVNAIFCALLVLSIVEMTIRYQLVKKQIRLKYPDDELPKMLGLYMYSRAMMLRRWRSPAPQVKRGEHPSVPSSK